MTPDQSYALLYTLIEGFADSVAATLLPILEAQHPKVADDAPLAVRKLVDLMPTPAEQVADYRRRLIAYLLDRLNQPA